MGAGTFASSSSRARARPAGTGARRGRPVNAAGAPPAPPPRPASAPGLGPGSGLGPGLAPPALGGVPRAAPLFAGGPVPRRRAPPAARTFARRGRGPASAGAAAAFSGADAGGGARHRFPPRTFLSEPGEQFLFQFGEGMRVEPLPAGTRVIYPGVRRDGERDPIQVRRMVKNALEAPVGSPPLRERIREARARAKAAGRPEDAPRVVIAFDDVSVPLPPMQSPDTRATIMEEVVAQLDELAPDADVEFVCSIALHRPIRPDEFRHICGRKLFRRFFPLGKMTNYNAVDMDETVDLGRTRHGEDVLACRRFVEADLAVYVNVNYVSMDGGYKSYATGLVHYRSLRYNHDCKTLKETNSLYDPGRSALHKSINRIGRVMQERANIFHVETVLDERLFPWYLDWVLHLERSMGWFRKLVMHVTCFFLRFVPAFLRKWTFWSFLVRAPAGLLQVHAGETCAVHERTLAANFREKVVDVEGQADILVLAPTCIGPYTKDMYFNPLLVNTYSLGYYFNMYVGGTPLLREGGVVVVVNPMEYNWSSPGHDAYRELFEEVIARKGRGGLDEFEAFQEQFAQNERLNDIYRAGRGPAGVHGFYMYTWAAHGMDKVSKVYAAGARDRRGPDGLGWEMAGSVAEAIEKARDFLGDPEAKATYLRAPPIGYLRVRAEGAPAPEGAGEEVYQSPDALGG